MPRASYKSRAADSVFPRSAAERREIREQRVAKHLKETRMVLMYVRNLMKLGKNRLSPESIHHMDECQRLIEEVRSAHMQNTPQD
jgi:polynucleotide 5'-kinase involved in rRNA processing